jgi:hypothetical protein
MSPRLAPQIVAAGDPPALAVAHRDDVPADEPPQLALVPQGHMLIAGFDPSLPAWVVCNKETFEVSMPLPEPVFTWELGFDDNEVPSAS